MEQANLDRVVVITGAGRGVGRAYALEFARQGAKVVVNDLGGGPTGSGASAGPAAEVVGEIRAAGGTAVANGDDVSSTEGAQHLIDAAVAEFGGLDVLVNNAGILRDRTLVNMTDDDWDAIVKVHLRGTFAPSRAAAQYWRTEAKEGRTRDARLINTSSSSGLFGNVGQANYGAAKAGIANFTIVASLELARYGVTANAVWPAAMSRLTEGILPGGDGAGEQHPLDPTFIAPVVAWLGSPASKDVTGRLIGIRGREITFAHGWEKGPSAASENGWSPQELDAVMADLDGRTRPNTPLALQG